MKSPILFNKEPLELVCQRHSVSVYEYFSYADYAPLRARILAAPVGNAIQGVISRAHNHEWSEIYVPLGAALSYQMRVIGLNDDDWMEIKEPHLYIPRGCLHEGRYDLSLQKIAKEANLVGILIDDDPPNFAKPRIIHNRPGQIIDSGFIMSEHYDNKELIELPFQSVRSIALDYLQGSIMSVHDYDQLQIMIGNPESNSSYEIEYETEDGNFQRFKINVNHQVLIPKGIKHQIVNVWIEQPAWILMINYPRVS